MHTLLIDVSALPAESWRDAARAGRLSLLARALRMGAEVAREVPAEDAPAAWLSPAERWMLHALALPEAGAALAEQRAPWGALAAAACGLPTDARPWALALPAHLVLGRDSLQLADRAGLELDVQDAHALLDAARGLLDEQDWQVRVLHPKCWLLSHPSLRDVRTADPLRAAGRNAAGWMPGGDAAAPWRRLLTEIQMVWLEHPVNVARQAAGLPEINTLWLHGCGVLATPPANPFVVDAAQRQGWLDGGCAWLAALADALPALAPTRHPHTLRVLQPTLGHSAPDELLARLDAEASGVLTDALREHAAARVVLAGHQGWAELELRRSRAWHFWRDAAARSLLVSV